MSYEQRGNDFAKLASLAAEERSSATSVVSASVVRSLREQSDLQAEARTAGIPDDAFAPIEGDDRAAARTIREQNANERAGQFDLFSSSGVQLTNDTLTIQTREVMHTLPNRLGYVVVARHRLQSLDVGRFRLRRVADAWCGALVQEKTSDKALSAITERALKWIATGPTSLYDEWMTERVERLSRRYLSRTT